MYTELRNLLPYRYKPYISSIRSYASSSLEFDNIKYKILSDEEYGKDVKSEKLKKLNEAINELTIILFLYSLNKSFLASDRMIKDTVDVFKNLEVNEIYIGSLSLSEKSEYYNMGLEFSEELVNSILSEELKELFLKSQYFHEIVEWFRGSRDGLV